MSTTILKKVKLLLDDDDDDDDEEEEEEEDEDDEDEDEDEDDDDDDDEDDEDDEDDDDDDEEEPTFHPSKMGDTSFLPMKIRNGGQGDVAYNLVCHLYPYSTLPTYLLYLPYHLPFPIFAHKYEGRQVNAICRPDTGLPFCRQI